MRHLPRLARYAAGFVIALAGMMATAQTTTTYTAANVPVSCGAFNASTYHCTLQLSTPEGPSAFSYSPKFNGNFNVDEFFQSPTELGGLGYAQVDGVTTNQIGTTVTHGIPNRQGYSSVSNWEEATTFHGWDYTGSTYIRFTRSTYCCSSGRDPGQHTAWAITYATVTVTK